MYALPGQSIDSALFDLASAVAFNTRIYPGTSSLLNQIRRFHTPPLVPTDTHIVDIEIAGHAYLAEQGLTAYEISAWSRQIEQRCRHNYQTWQYGDYLGIGAGRWENHPKKCYYSNHSNKTPKQYMRKQHAINDNC